MSTSPLDVVNRVVGARSDSGAKELETDFLKVRGNTLIFENTIYQIRNIAAIEMVPLRANIPWLAVLVVLLAVYGIFFNREGIIIVISLIGGAWALFSLYKYWQRRKQYGLLILLNSGIETSTIIIGPDRGFIIQVMKVLYDIMNDNAQSVDIIFDQKQILINGITHSTIVAGSSVGGNVVNTIS